MNSDGTISYQYYRARADYIHFAEYALKVHKINLPKFWKLFGEVPRTDAGSLKIWLELFEQKAVLKRRGFKLED